MKNDTLLRFYEGTGRDARGRAIEDIWRFSLEDLEYVHDYIQWLFPLAERSAFNPDAPLLDADTIDRFRKDARLANALERSLDVMLAFYGLARQHGRNVRAPNFNERARVWLTPHNHNFLRLTRIIKSLRLLGATENARQLLACLEQIYRDYPDVIGPTTLRYWRAANE